MTLLCKEQFSIMSKLHNREKWSGPHRRHTPLKNCKFRRGQQRTLYFYRYHLNRSGGHVQAVNQGVEQEENEEFVSGETDAIVHPWTCT